MKAAEQTIGQILHSNNQYVIPVFQRYYSWSRQNWEELWGDLMELNEAEADGPRQHFMGSVVVVPEKHYPNVVPAYQVIDGQQRLVTLTLLLCAIRDVAWMQGFDQLGNEIRDTFLIHSYKKGRERFRVYPRQRDRDQYQAIIDGKTGVDGPLARALEFFTRQILTLSANPSEQDLGSLFGLVQARLMFVLITLDGENPYRIFRSLNSTGLDLSEADLIRNFVFMHVSPEQQDEFDDDHWKPLERHFVNADDLLDGRALSAFFRDVLMTDGRYVVLAGTFESFEKRYGSDTFDPQQLLAVLQRHVVHYDVIRGIRTDKRSDVAAALGQLQALDSSTTYPLVLRLFRLNEEGKLSDSDLAKAIHMLASFILRRFVVGESSRPYGRWFVAACTELKDEPIQNLAQYLRWRGFPSDTLFKAAFVRFDLYHSRYARSILEALERAQKHKEPADLSNTEIEHIMPQTLSAQWKADLGSDADRVHAEWLHTVGNLTLSAYNPPLGNKPFAAKRVEYQRSNITLTRSIGEFTTWGEAVIRQRGEWLAEIAAKVWIGPDDAT